MSVPDRKPTSEKPDGTKVWIIVPSEGVRIWIEQKPDGTVTEETTSDGTKIVSSYSGDW